MKQLLHSFNGGEVSPMLAGRVDLPGMMRACRRLRNFIPVPTGGAVRRPSLLYVGDAVGIESRLVPFLNGTNSFILELSNLSLRVWSAVTRAVVATLVSPWSSSQVPLVQFAQSNDVMWLVHPDVAPYELVRTSGGWTLDPMPFAPTVINPYGVWPPLRGVNLSDVTLEIDIPEVTGVAGASVLTASAAMFDADMVGGFFQVSHYREAVEAEIQVAVTAIAQVMFAMTANPTAGEQFSIGSVVYKFVSGTPAAPYELKLAATLAETKAIVMDAINGVTDSATVASIGLGTAVHPYVEASDGGSVTTGTAATATLTFLSQVLDGATVTINGQVYTFKNTLSAAYHVKIGANAQSTLENLIQAMDLTGVAGTDYGVGTVAHPTVNANARVGNVATFYARTAGTGGNALTLAHNTGSVSTYGVRWSASTLTGGVDASTEQVLLTARELGTGGNGIEVAETMTNGSFSASSTSGGTQTDDESETVNIKGGWDFTTVGRWQGTVYIERQNAAGTWEVVRQYTGKLDTNITDEGIADVAADYRVRVVGIAGTATSEAASPRFILTGRETVHHGLVEVYSFTSSTVVNVTVYAALYSTDPTPLWREGAFSAHRGFPAAVALHEERLLFGGNSSEPQKVWGSAAGDFRNFEETGLADGSWQWSFSSQQAQRIRWMVSARGLVIGTDVGERTWDSGENGITPLHPPLQRQMTFNGSTEFQAVPVNDVILFVHRSGLKLLEYSYEESSASYIAPELTQLADHLVANGIKEIAIQKVPWQVAWVVTRGNGELLSLTYSRRDEVVGWAKHPTGTNVKSVASVPADGTDEIWCIVQRSFGGGFYIERLDTAHLNTIARGASADMWHLDHAVQGSGVGTTITGLSRLNGQTVKVLTTTGGVVAQADAVVSGGSVTVPSPASAAVIGLACEDAELQPQMFDFVTETGTSIGRRFNCKRAHIRFHMSGECKYAKDVGDTEYSVLFGGELGFTGLKTIQVPASFEHGVSLILKADGIHSCNVLSIVPEFELYGGR